MRLESIGNHIRIERHRRGLTQKLLGEMAGVSKGRVEAIECGRALDMGVGTVNAVLVALGFRLDVVHNQDSAPEG